MVSNRLSRSSEKTGIIGISSNMYFCLKLKKFFLFKNQIINKKKFKKYLKENL
jgi:hypothetical protein